MFLSDIHSAFRDKVNLFVNHGFLEGIYMPFLEFIVKGIDLIVESGSTDFTSFVEKMDGEETTLTTLIMPFFDIGFIGDAYSDCPSIVSQSWTRYYLF